MSPGQAFYAESDAPVPLAPTDPTLRIRYYHQDHLGSSSVITDNAGGLVEETAFYIESYQQVIHIRSAPVDPPARAYVFDFS